MFAQALARRLSRAGVHYGWAIVAIVGTQSAREQLVEARA